MCIVIILIIIIILSLIFLLLSHSSIGQFSEVSNLLVFFSHSTKAIWNWMDNYPHEFTELHKQPNDELQGILLKTIILCLPL